MKNLVIAISMLMSASVGQAETLKPSLIQDMITVLKSTTESEPYFKAFQRLSSQHFPKQVGLETLNKDGFAVVAAGTRRSESVVMKFNRIGSEITQGADPVRTLAKSESIEIGFLRVPQGDLRKEVQDLVLKHGEITLFGGSPHVFDSKALVAGNLWANNVDESIRALQQAFEKLSIETKSAQALPKLVKVGEKKYAILTSLRIELKDLSAQQVQALVEEAAALL